jgi:hypothetical protein
MNRQTNGSPRCQTTACVHKGFAQYQGKRIAIVLMHRDRPTRFAGVAQYQEDELLGPVLRIPLKKGKSPSQTDLIVSEVEWNGRVLPDPLHGCDFSFIPGPGSPVS